MQQWDRNTTGRLERTSAPQEQGCEVSLHSNQMEPPPEEQQSQQGIPRNPNAYMLMRDHIHPPRVSAPSCIVPPAEDVGVRPYLVPLFPTFHGMENENPYTHIREFVSCPRDPGPTRLVDPNQSPGHDTICTIYYTVLGLSLTCSFLELYLYLWVYKQFL